VATAAARDADNRDALLEPLRREAGIEVSVLSGEEEARLGALAALRTFAVVNGLIVDLGGGSLQATEVRNRSATATASFPLGAVRMTDRFRTMILPFPGRSKSSGGRFGGMSPRGFPCSAVMARW